MEVIYSRKTGFKRLLLGLFSILFLLLMPFRLWAQTVVPCNDSQSWIARWTLSSTVGPGQLANMTDGDNLTYNDISIAGPWVFITDFGILRHLTGIKLYSGSGTYSPRSYEILVSIDNLVFTSVMTGTLQYYAGIKEQLIDFNGYVEAKYVRIIIKDAFTDVSTFNQTRLRLWEVNYLQCGVDPLIAQTITPGVVIAPSLSCADAVSKDIQGVINTYFPGLADANIGNSTIDVDMNHVRGAAHILSPGDRVLIIQMQNTVISEANSMAYGDGIDNDLIASGWKDVRNTGEYEFAIVGSVSGNTIQLTQPLQKSYAADGVFQVVYSPVYDNTTLTGPVNAFDWDGYCGGIVTFDARTLNLNNQIIDVSSQGFRKGKKNSNSGEIRYFWGVYCTDVDAFFGEKGEGIAGNPRGSYFSDSKRLYSIENTASNSGGSYGRGAPGNAGGGGANHNSGGGGGANIGSGGQGGASFGYTDSGDMTKYWNIPSPDGGGYDNAEGYYPNGGMGGTGSGTPDPFRIWMGGAGGGGHQNNNAASGGSNGGGIILATARVVKGNGSFYANGNSAGDSGNDGAGGGGAGGTIVFGFNDQSGATISYSAKGGNGGNVTNRQPHGPAGGGGGGAIIVSALSSSGNMDVSGGQNGVHALTMSQWGANKGQDGKTLVANNLSALYTYSCDHGDAPLSFLDAAHQIKPDSPSFNTPGDADPMAINQPPHDKDAKGDDMTDSPDEDGVEPFDPTLSTGQSIYTVTVNVNNPLNAIVYICGWIDFNGNGLFESSEKSYLKGAFNGQNVLTWNSFPDITGGDTYARFRISTGMEALQPTSVAPDGEVEDYTIHIIGIPQATPDAACTHEGLPVDIHVVDNDNIQGDQHIKLAIQTYPVKGTLILNDHSTPDDVSDDYITYTPNPGFQGTDTFTYELQNALGNRSKAMVTVTVKEQITVDFSTTPNEGCTPLKINFINLSSDKTALFTWEFGDNTLPVQGVDAVHTYKTAESTSVYTIMLRMNTGCGIIETTKQIKVFPLPHAVMTVASNEERPEIVILTDVSANVVDRIWTVDGIIKGHDSINSVEFKTIGPHTISLKVFNELGCSDDSVLIHTTVFRGLYVPNAFLPENTDNLPRTFLPVGIGLKEYTLMIFDLWGNLIWTDKELDSKGQPVRGWDGKDKNGTPLPTDTYIWRIKAVLEGNKPWKGMKMPNGSYHTEGPLTIIR